MLAQDWAGAEADARWALDQGATESDSPIGRYAGCLALLVLGHDEAANDVAASLQNLDDFPADVADALAGVARRDREAYLPAITQVLASFEKRDEYLEDIPVADTVVVLQALADRRGLAATLHSALLPPS